jgi:hypothetical protein
MPGGGEDGAVACPYCAAPVPAAAIRCATCRADLAIVMPAMRILADQARALAALRAEVAALRDGLAMAPAAPAEAAARGTAPSDAEAATGRQLLRLAAPLGVLLLLLLGTHWLVVVAYDLPTVVLRVASIVLPFLLALLAPSSGRVRLGVHVAGGVVLGIVAALAMSAVVAQLDGVPVVPDRPREQRELLEYMASIGLAYVAGAALARLALLRRTARRAATGPGGAGALVDRATMAQRIAEALTPVAALLASVYGGLRALLD